MFIHLTSQLITKCQSLNVCPIPFPSLNFPFVRFGAAKVHILFSSSKYFFTFLKKYFFNPLSSYPSFIKKRTAKILILSASAKFILGDC
jgi:hypothetical protein